MKSAQAKRVKEAALRALKPEGRSFGVRGTVSSAGETIS